MSAPVRRLEQLAGLFVLLLVAIGCFVVLRPFLAALLWATILSIATWPAFRRLERVTGGRTTLAAAVMTIALAVALLVPIGILGTSLADNFARLSSQVISVLEGGRRRRRHGLSNCRWLVPIWRKRGTTLVTTPVASPIRCVNTLVRQHNG